MLTLTNIHSDGELVYSCHCWLMLLLMLTNTSLTVLLKSECVLTRHGLRVHAAVAVTTPVKINYTNTHDMLWSFLVRIWQSNMNVTDLRNKPGLKASARNSKTPDQTPQHLWESPATGRQKIKRVWHRSPDESYRSVVSSLPQERPGWFSESHELQAGHRASSPWCKREMIQTTDPDEQESRWPLQLFLTSRNALKKTHRNQAGN